MTLYEDMSDEEQCETAGIEVCGAGPVRRETAWSTNRKRMEPRAEQAEVEDLVAPMDVCAARELTCGDQAILEELAQAFEDEAPGMVDELTAAVEGGVADSVYRAAHKLKGALGVFCAGPTTRAAEQLEQMGRQNELTLAHDVLLTLMSELKRLRSALGGIGREVPHENHGGR